MCVCWGGGAGRENAALCFWWFLYLVFVSERIESSVFLVTIVYHEPQNDGRAFSAPGSWTDVSHKAAGR